MFKFVMGLFPGMAVAIRLFELGVPAIIAIVLGMVMSVSSYIFF